jgi:uncharacterized UPF0160 family protein
LEAFANLYRNFFLTVDALDNGNTLKEECWTFQASMRESGMIY